MLIAAVGSQSLTGPSHDLKLKAITLGHGTQNYTCDYGSPAPVAVGAKAELLDASALLPLLPKNEATQILNQLPGYLANYNFDMIENSTIPVIGTHIFTADKVPYFFLGKLGILGGKKAEAIAAPSTGKDVDWLKLEAITGSVGLTTVYRLATAKGVPPKTCVGQPKDILVPYAAQYWFYG